MSGNMKFEDQAVLLSAGKKATAEDYIEGHEPQKALNDESGSYWAGGPYYKWWKVDLQSLCQLSRIVIHAGELGGCVHYFIECSDDNLNWNTVAEKIDDTLANEEGESYDLPVTARYVRVTITYNSSGEQAIIRHVQVYGRPLDKAEDDNPGMGIRAPFLFPAVNGVETKGFSIIEIEDLEPGEQGKVLIGHETGSYAVYRGVDFADGVNQLRGHFGFTNPDKEKRITVEVRVDGLQGEKIGEIVLFKQWKMWSILGGVLEHKNPEYLRGIHDVYLIIITEAPDQSVMINWLAFVQASPLPKPKPRSRDLPAPQGKDYEIYFGNLHSHTGFSDGIGVPDYAFDYARYTAGLDFLAITEHSNLYDHYLDWDKSRKLKDLFALAERKTEDGKFLALIGSETTWYNQFGHMNTFNMDFFINAYETRFNDIPTYYDTIKQYPDTIHQWNHPWSCGKRHLDNFEPFDAELDEVLHMIEINTIESKELGGMHYYVKALDKGWHLAPAGNQDNHHGQWGSENTLRTAVLVDKLTREHFFDAVRRQRVYFTSALELQVWFRLNGEIMGSRIARSENLDFHVKASYRKATGGQIVKLEVIGEQGRILHSQAVDSDSCDIRFTLPCTDKYYFVKVYQQEWEFAATAPVWIED